MDATCGTSGRTRPRTTTVSRARRARGRPASTAPCPASSCRRPAVSETGYRQEYYAGEAEDMFEIIEVGGARWMSRPRGGLRRRGDDQGLDAAGARHDRAEAVRAGRGAKLRRGLVAGGAGGQNELVEGTACAYPVEQYRSTLSAFLLGAQWIPFMKTTTSSSLGAAPAAAAAIGSGVTYAGGRRGRRRRRDPDHRSRPGAGQRGGARGHGRRPGHRHRGRRRGELLRGRGDPRRRHAGRRPARRDLRRRQHESDGDDESEPGDE